MEYAVEMSSGTMIYILSFIMVGSGIQKLIGGFTNTQTIWRSHKPTLGKYAKIEYYRENI
jgi:hypothetical protein